jgi:hypothetical protein
VQLIEEPTHFITAEDDRQSFGPSGARDVSEPGKIDAKDALVKKENRGQCLRLCRGRHILCGGEMRQERLDVGTAEGFRVLAVVKPDESYDPPDILLLSAIAVVALADFSSYEVEESWFRSGLHNRSAAFDDIRRPWSI